MAEGFFVGETVGADVGETVLAVTSTVIPVAAEICEVSVLVWARADATVEYFGNEDGAFAGMVIV